MKAKILVVDDEEAVALFVKKILSNKGYEVITAKDAMEAINRLHDQEFHAVITDKNMPGTAHPNEGGLDVLQESKTINPSCGVLMMTAYATVDSAIKAMRMGVFDYVNKPFRIDELCSKVERLIQLQGSIDPINNLAAYNELRQEFFTLFDEQHGETNREEAREKFMEKVQATLDTVFQERRSVEQTLVEQRDALLTIAALAAELNDTLDDNTEIKAVVEKIAEHALGRI